MPKEAPLKVSIIVPVYNVKDYLSRCLNSILAQTLKEWECICVDDGSTDGSCAILDEYAAKDAALSSSTRRTAAQAVRGMRGSMWRGENT